jgi:Asp-tRNA(Asn)/Glu-tRNA(Gln) amidotransferase C subunit
MELTPDRTAALADAVGLDLPSERLEPVTEALAELLGLAHSLEELPLDGVEPLLGPPVWD